jgi:flavin reductase (DIM6/NTAB) family NADH-FMN oxidoreductase RutF
VDTRLLRRALGAFATGVTVVTVGGGTPHGMTANSFTSVSLDPPLVLVCVDRSAVMHRGLLAGGLFGVSVLAAGQEGLARHFACRSRPLGLAQFADIGWRPGPRTGAPLLDGALARIECALWRTYDGGDHTIFLANLLTVETSAGGADGTDGGAGDGDGGPDALLFFRGRFTSLGRKEVTA